MSLFKKIKEKFTKTKKGEKKEIEEWFREEKEGELSIDAYETKKEFVIVSTIGGVKAEDLDISIDKNMLTIKGEREKPKNREIIKNYFYEECFWGPFSRRILLPEEVNIDRAKAIVKDGVLILRIPKTKINNKKAIEIKDR
jgi:HSP20 family protein